MANTCPECSTTIQSGATQCRNCGFPLDGVQKSNHLWEIGGPIKNQAVREYIQSNTSSNEKIIATAIGLSGDFLLVTARKIAIIKKGIATWATGGFGLKAKSYMLSKVSSIDISRGLIFCDLEIVSGGMVEKSQGSFFAAAESENVFQFEKSIYDEMTKLVNLMRDLIEECSRPKPVAVTAAPQPPDLSDQLRKLAQLLSDGLISQEEFEAKKKDLLARL